MRKIKKNSSTKLASRLKRQGRIRKKIFGTSERPRLSLFRGNQGLFAQLIDDTQGKTLVGIASPKGKYANIEIAKALGQQIASKANASGIKSCVFDRAGNLYHGRVAAFAESARASGLNF